jgi:hypothetical protein
MLRVRAGIGLVAAITVTLTVAQRLEDTDAVPLDHKAIQYAEFPANDPVALLEKRVEKEELKLEFQRNRWGYLPTLLKQLGVNADSQVLVFSKTSFQAERVSPARPRAIYFNDNVSVGFVQGGETLELASLDPKQGVIFYTLDARNSAAPEFARRDDCLNCHRGPQTLGVPGRMISSLYPRGVRGSLHAGSFLTDHRTPIEERWGGWYVTGRMGSQRHLGNAIPSPLPGGGIDPRDFQSLTSLDEKLDTSAYLSPTSDVVALMTLEHQTRMTNLITRIGWEFRIAQADGKLASSRSQLNSAVDEMAAYMLFADEAPIREPIEGVSTFTKTFPQRGPRDKQGRSFRDFDLRKRLFRYPLSYMVYSDAFDGMPEIARERMYQRLYDVLTGKDAAPKFARLSAEDRRAVLEILRDTKPNLPVYWSQH